MKAIVEVNYHGINFIVYGNHVKAEEQTREYSGSPSGFEIEEIEHNGEMIQDVLCESVKEDLIDKCREELDLL